MVREEQLNPAGHFVQADAPAALISSELQATQALEEEDPALGLAVPAAHVDMLLDPPKQLKNINVDPHCREKQNLSYKSLLDNVFNVTVYSERIYYRTFTLILDLSSDLSRSTYV